MAVQNEVIKLLLQFETAFSSQNSFSDFVKNTKNELNSLDEKIKGSSEELNTFFNYLKAGTSLNAAPLKNLFNDLSQATETKGIVENSKILKQSIESLQQVLDKKLDIANLESSLAKIQEKFIPSKGIGADKSAEFAGKFLKSIEEQFKAFASGSMDLNSFFDNLFPKDIKAKVTTEKIKAELATLKGEVEKGVTDLTNLTTEKRVEILEFIGKKILADSTQLKVAANTVKGDGKQLVDAIVNMASSLQSIGFLPPKDFFPNFAQGLKEQGAVQKDVIKEVLKGIVAQFNAKNFELEKSDIAFKILENLGFNKSTLEAQFKTLNSTAKTEFENFKKNIDQALASPATLDVTKYLGDFKKFMSDAFKSNALVSFGDEFQNQFKKVATELNGFKQVSTQSLGDVKNFENGILALITALESGKGAGTPAATALKELLEVYLQVEKSIRFDTVLKTQGEALNEFGMKFKELKNTLEKAPTTIPEYTLKLVTNDNAGNQAFKDREEALAKYNALLKETTDASERTARSIAHLETLQKSVSTEAQQKTISDLIDQYKTYQQTLSNEANVLRKNQVDWESTWLRKTQDLKFAEERVQNFFKILNTSSDTGIISGTTSYLKGLLQIGTQSTDSAKALESAFQIFSNFGGVTKESLQYLELFEKAIGSLFKSMGQGEGKVTLIDLNGLKSQADGTIVATETLRNSLIKLAGSSKDAQENFQNLALANDFLANTQGAADTTFGKQISALFALAQAAKLYVNNIETLILKNGSYDESLRRVQAAELEVRESFKKVQSSPQDASAIDSLTQAYQKYTREVAAAEIRLKELKNLQTELATQKNAFGFTEAGQQLPGLEAGIRSTTALIEQLKNKILDLVTSGDGSKIFENIVKGAEQGNQQLKSSFDNLEKTISGRLLAITEKLNTDLSKVGIGKGLFDQIQNEVNNLSVALKTANVDSALIAIQALVSKIQTALDPQNVPVNKDLAQTYLAPIKELLKGLEVAQKAIATIIPKLGEGQKGKAEELLKNVQTQIVATNTALNDFGKTANTVQLATRFEEALNKAIDLQEAIKKLNVGTVNSKSLSDLELQLRDVRKEVIDLSKEGKSLGFEGAISSLNHEITVTKGLLRDLGKGSQLEGLQAQFNTLKTAIPPVIATVDSLKNLLQESFAGNKELVNVAPFTKLKNDLQAIERTITDTEQKAPYTKLLAQVQDAIDKTERYNAVVKSGNSRDVGVQALIDPKVYTETAQKLRELDDELTRNRASLSLFLSGSNQTAEGAKQLTTAFAITRESLKDLTKDAGELSGTSSNLEKHIKNLLRAGTDATLVKILQDVNNEIKNAINTKEALNKAFQSGFTKDLETDLNRLTNAKTLMEQFRAIGDSFRSSAFFDSTSYSARQAYEQIQRLESAMRNTKNDIDKSLSVGRRDTIDPGVAAQLAAQRTELEANISKLKELGQVYDQLRSKSKIEAFEQLKNTLNTLFEGGSKQGILDYQAQFQAAIGAMQASIASLKTGVDPLTESFVNSFKRQSESITATREQLEQWLVQLRSLEQNKKVNFELADGQKIPISGLISAFQNMVTAADAIKAPIKQVSEDLQNRLGTASGQAELKITGLIEKFGALQTRINTINPGNNIQEIYGSIKELMELLNRPYKSGPFFTLPKESFAPIRNEILSVLEVAKNLQTALEFKAQDLDKNSQLFKQTQESIAAAREEVTRLSSALLRLSEYEKNASNFSALRGNLHGASTTLQELAHEGAFIYKGLEALFKNLAKNLTGPVVTINTSTLNQQLDQLTTKFGVTGTAADHLKTQVKEALNTQLGGGGLAAAEQYQKAFQQLEEAFVKFRSGLTQAAMGFQMLGDSLLEPFKKAKENYEQFSDTMGAVSAVTNATASQFAALTQQALLMGATTRFTAEQAAEGLKELSKAGFTAEEQIATLPAVMRLAQAAATELSVAAQIATVVMNEFRMDPEQFNQASDAIALAANSTLASVEDLGYAFKYVGALASNIGGDFNELTAAIAILHNAGMKGTMAGTALRGMLMNLYNPTKEDERVINQLSERIGGLGLQIQDANGNFLGFSSILKQLEQAGITSGEVLKLFGQRAGPGMAALLAQGSDALIELEEKLKSAEGTTAHMAEIMEQTLKGKLLLMRSAFQALSDQIGHNLAPTLMLAADAMADFVSRFVAVREEFPVLASVLDHVLGGIALFASTLGGLAVTFAFILVPVRQFMGFLKTLIVTTLVGAASITSLSAAQAFNVKVTAATIAAAEAEFAARVATAQATGADTTATGLNTIARGINVKAIRAQMIALHGANEIIARNIAAQTSLWVGVKNIFLGLGKSLLNIGGMMKWAFTTPWGLALTALTSVVAYTLLHEKSVSQANEELKKQSELLTYSQKEAQGLSATLVNTAERIKQTQKQLNELSNRKTDQSGLSPEKQSQATQLQIQLDFDKQKLNEQLRELYTRLSEEGSKLKNNVTFEVALDDKGTFTAFKVNVKGAAEAIDVFANGASGAAEQLKKLAPELDRVAEAEKRLLAQQQLGNILRENLGSGDLEYQTDFGRNINVITEDIKNILGLGSKTQKAEAELENINALIAHFEETKKSYAESNANPFSPFTYGPEVFKGLDKTLSNLQVKATSARLKISDNLKGSADAVLNDLVTSTGLSAEKVARLPNLSQLIQEKTKIIFKEQNVSFKYFDDVVLRLTKQFKDIENATTVTEITSEAFRKPFNEIVSALVNFEGALEEKNKELKKQIKEQENIFKDVKPLVDAFKKYEAAFVKFDKANLDQKTKTLEFDIKVDNDKILSELSQQLEQVTVVSKIVDLPVSINADFATTKNSLLKGMESVRGIVLNYEKSINEDLIYLKLQQANQEYETVVKTEQGKQQAIRESLTAITDFYKNKNADFYQLEQEKLTALVDSLKNEYEATVSHVNKLYTLRAGLAQKSQQLDADYTTRQATAASNLQKLALGTKSDSQKQNFLKEQIKALKELADEAVSSDNLDRAKALLDQQQQLITQAIGEVAGTKGKGGYKAFLKEFQEQNLEDTGGVIDGLKSQSSAAQDLLTAQIEENKNKIKELSNEAKTLGVSLTEALAELQKTTELDIGISAQSYEKLRAFAQTYKDILRELNNFEIDVGIDVASDPETIEKTIGQLKKLQQQQQDIQRRSETVAKARETVKPVLATQGVSNAISDIITQTEKLFNLLNNTKGELDEKGLKTYEEGVKTIQQKVEGLKVALADSNLDPELRKEIEGLIVAYNNLQTGEGLAKQVEADGEEFVKRQKSTFEQLRNDSEIAGKDVGKTLRDGYFSALEGVTPTLKKALDEAVKSGDVSAVRDILKLTNEAIIQSITGLENLKKQGILTPEELTRAESLLQTLKDIVNTKDESTKKPLEIKTEQQKTLQNTSTETINSQEAINKKLTEQQQQQQGVTKETKNTTTAVAAQVSATSTAVEQTNTLKTSIADTTKESNIFKDAWVSAVTALFGIIPAAAAATTEVEKLNNAAQGNATTKSNGLLSIFSTIKQSAKDTYADVAGETTAFFDKISSTKINLSQLEKNFFGFFTDSIATIKEFTAQVETVDLATPLNKEVDTVLRASERLNTELSNTAFSSFVTDTAATFEQFAELINASINGLNISDAFGREIDQTLKGFDKLKNGFDTSTFGTFIDDTTSTFSTFSTLVNAEAEKVDFSLALGREMALSVDAVKQGSSAIVEALSSSSFYVDWLKPFAQNTQTTLSTLNALASNETDKFVKNFDLSETSEMKGFTNFVDFTKQKANELVDAFGNTTEAKALFNLFDTAVEKTSTTLNKLGAAGKQQGEELDNAFKQSLYMYNIWKNAVEKPVAIDNTAFQVFQNAESTVNDVTTAAVNFLQTLPQLQTKSESVAIFSTLTSKVKTILEETKAVFNTTLAFIKDKADTASIRFNIKINKDKALAEAAAASTLVNQNIQETLKPYDVTLKIVSNSEQLVEDALLKGLNTLNEYTKQPQLIDIRYVYQDAERLDELTKKIKELRSQQPQGIFKTPLVDSAELQQLQQLLLQEYAKPILLDVTKAQQQNTSLRNEITQPVVANVNLKKAESELSILLARRKNLEINPKVNASELTTLNLQIKNLENKIIKIKLQAPAPSSFSPLGAESIIKSGEISNALRTSLNEVQQFKKSVNNVWTNTEAKQGVKMDLDTVQLEHQLKDAKGKVQIWHEQVQRLTATGLDIGGKQLAFPIPNFQVQASTWEQLVSEGNRYMKLRAQVEIDPSFANQVQDVKPVVTPTVNAASIDTELNKIELKKRTVQIDFEPPTNADVQKELEEFNSYKLMPEIDLQKAKDEAAAQYKQMVQDFGKGNPIEVTADANKFIGAIQAELAAFQNAGATNIKVTLDETTNKLIVTADVEQANSKAKELANQIATMNPVMTVNIKYNDPGAPSGSGSLRRNQGGLIGSIQHFADGGLAKFKELASTFVPGSGNTDTVPAMLTPGEFVIKKDRVKELGVDFLNSLNSGLIQFKSMGGMIYNSPINTLNSMTDYIQPKIQIPNQQAQTAGGPPINVNLTIKDKTFSIKTPRDEAKKLVNALQYLERGLK